MADPLHLERMGRELKCPICLSLFNSAVSLTCNHAFCGVCIEKSMKSASDCPVCKVPFRRREIRPAPHMDNLVSIYKSMEVASGLDIFVSQNVPSFKSPAQKDQGNGHKECEMQETGKSVVGKTTAQERLKRSKKRGRPSKACITTSSDAGKPSFPTKKRVHVTQYPLPETPMQCEKLTNEADATAHSEPEKSSRLQREKLVLNENRESTLAPFFWLRDEDEAENTTQQTNLTAFTGTPVKIPSFSDIKALDDDIPVKATPDSGMKGTCAAPQDDDFIDSEMFEWTQRPCSPELYTSPMKTQVVLVKDSYDTDIQEENRCVSPDGATTLKLGFDNTELMNEKEEGNASLGSSYSRMKKTVAEKSTKTFKRDKGIKKKRKNKDRVAVGVPTSFIKPLKGTKLVTRKSENCGNGSRAANESGKPDNEVHTNSKATEFTPEVAPKVNDAVCLNAASDSKIYKEASMLKKNRTTRKNDNLQSRCHSKTDTPKLKADEHQMIQKCKASTSLVAEISPAERTLVSNEGMIIRKCQVNNKVKNKEPKRVKFSKESRTLDNLVDNPQLLGINSKVASEAQRLEVSKSISRDRDSSSKEAKCAKSLPNRGDTAPNEVVCAFCHSAEESEATGTMVHYLQGKPIVGDLAEGPNILHCHKNCTEWAPNVFFQDDSAINLESELTRSRRITCSLCGIKGAALGCYHKSCRKSFHVPCALMTPECRWDNDNFVMLCPIHASCKLPRELPGPQSSQKRKPAPKRNNGIQKEVSKDDNIVCSRWKSHMESKNLVLCCSGLIDTEKEIVSQFEKLSEIRILKNWDSSVTHVIASTNKDGACKRTLKVLMGILEGKWILTIEWVKACLTSMEVVNEQLYEVNVDTHGVRNGPSLGRLRVLTKKPKLFNGLKFYFTGDFEASYKRFLQDLVIAGGGTVLHRKPLSGDRETNSSGQSASTTYIIYNLELPQNCKPSKICSIADRRRLDAEALASSTGAEATSNTWILDSIAGFKLQRLTT